MYISFPRGSIIVVTHHPQLRTARCIHTAEHAGREGGLLLLLNLLLLLLLLLLLAVGLASVFRHRRLKVFVPCERQHVDTLLFPVRQATPYEALKRRVLFPISFLLCTGAFFFFPPVATFRNI
jgi:hypothetical protein